MKFEDTRKKITSRMCITVSDFFSPWTKKFIHFYIFNFNKKNSDFVSANSYFPNKLVSSPVLGLTSVCEMRTGVPPGSNHQHKISIF